MELLSPQNATKNSDFIGAVCHLYFLLVNADGKVDEKEERLGREMAEAEGIDLSVFQSTVEALKSQTNDDLLQKCMTHMRRLDERTQIRILAWISNLANADGFMDKKEWALIYQIYNKELNLDLSKIMAEQRKINAMIFGKNSMSFGVRVN